MSEYTSTREGYEQAMYKCLTGSPEIWLHEFVTPDFYHVVNGHRNEVDTYIGFCLEWAKKITDYQPKITEFLRDGDQLAARLVGSCKVDGVHTEYESFMFAVVDESSGKLKSMIERAVW